MRNNKGFVAMVATVLTVVPIFSAAPAVSAQVAEGANSAAQTEALNAANGGDLGVNLLVNPGFENLQGGIPLPWEANNNKWQPDKAYVTSDAARTGNYGVQVQTTWIGQVVNVASDKAYEFSSWMKCQDTTHVQLKYEYYRDTVDGAGYLGGTRAFADVGTDWVKNKIDVTIPSDANKVKAYIMMPKTGGICDFDDTALYRIQQIPGVNVLSNKAFYYEDEDQGTISGTIGPDDQIYDNKFVDVSIAPKDGGAAVVQQSGIPLPSDGNFTYRFNPELLTLHQPYAATVTLKTYQGETLNEDTETIYRWERPTMMRKDGTLIVDGKPFFPTFGYHVPIGDFSKVGGSINTIQYSDTKRSQQNLGLEKDIELIQYQLDEAQKYGLKVVLPLYFNTNDLNGPKGEAYTRAIVSKFKDHPALLAYYMSDEPDLYNRSMDGLAAYYAIVRSEDPVHPTFIVVNSESEYQHYFRYADVLGEDIYPLPSAITPVGHAVHHSKELFPDRPVWAILQTFTMKGWPYLPNITEVRNMAYQSVLEGAQGLSYYSFTDPDWYFMDSPLYPDIVNFNQTEIPTISDIVTNGTKVDSYKDNNVQWGTWKKGNQLYAVAVNLTKDQQSVTIPLQYQGYEVRTIAPESSQSNLLTDHLSLTLPALQSTLIELTPFTSVVENSEAELLGAKLLIQHPHWTAYIDTIQQQLQMLDQALVSGQTDMHDASIRAKVVLQHIDNLADWLTNQHNVDGDKDQALGVLSLVRQQIQMIQDTIAIQ
jgi:hypothetical protein